MTRHCEFLLSPQRRITERIWLCAFGTPSKSAGWRTSFTPKTLYAIEFGSKKKEVIQNG